jgi:hypothetical protein
MDGDTVIIPNALVEVNGGFDHLVFFVSKLSDQHMAVFKSDVFGGFSEAHFDLDAW